MARKDFEDFFSCLNAAEVNYLLIGGVAYNYYADPRLTKDIDIWVEPTTANLERLKSAVVAFGYPTEGMDTQVAVEAGAVFMLGRAPWRIDVLTRPKGLTFASCAANAVSARYGEMPVQVLGITDLIASKKAAGRPHDLADAEELQRIAALEECD